MYNTDTEHWKTIAGFPAYEISTFGRLRSWYRLTENREPTILSCGYRKEGYRHTRLTNGSLTKVSSIHRLVAAAFCQKRDPAHNVVRHKDGDPLNNRADNLEWGTHQENTEDARRHGTLSFGDKNPCSRLTRDQVFEIFADGKSTCEQLASKYHVTVALISGIRQRKKRVADLGKGEKGLGAVGMGQRPPFRKLKAEDAVEIFLSHLSNADCAIQFGVGAPIISRIRSRQLWRAATSNLPDQERGPEPANDADTTGGLSVEQIREVFTSPLSGAEIAAKLGTSECTVSLIRNRKIGSNYTSGMEAPRRDTDCPLTAEDAKAIYAMNDEYRVIAAKYGVSKAMVGYIKNRKWWRDATRSLWPDEPDSLKSAGGCCIKREARGNGLSRLFVDEFWSCGGMLIMNSRPVVAMAVCHKDVEQALLWLRWVAFLSRTEQPGTKSAQMVVMATRRVYGSGAAVQIANEVVKAQQATWWRIDMVECPDELETGYPQSASHLFLRTLEYCETTYPGRSVLWVEPDCIPIHPNWYRDIVDEYETCGHAFMSQRIPHPGRHTSHLMGNAVYPHDWRIRAPRIVSAIDAPDHPMFGAGRGQPWDVWACEETTADMHESGRFQQIFNAKPFNRDRLSLLKPGVGLFHRCKDGTLITESAKARYPEFLASLPPPTLEFQMTGHPSRLRTLGYPEMPWRATKRPAGWVSVCQPRLAEDEAVLRCLAGTKGIRVANRELAAGI